ncbi:FliC/FljB family flagellin [Citrobacter portucalensis]|uniref:FliC/FljB family flagellin n=1 Tax=Citrobacter portucalensis TaxID=1639133 RepID=UPI000FEB94CB|nr:FliC/FljB family flagellin [Citrobacter portucalensis]RWT90189.1 flagellin FliC [Citrobacter freundii]MDV0512390.1 FliC/FljB family flagellin [Citrobacter portucalensis]MDV0516913.1 FliC/FljB family flagellin [Citrobacter portucalensis]MDV0562428.1 FliC/FljB family flagellin [Citrobacter portucalensis]MEB0750368.1 FliC/FljB family flagellin [Citrobacter portucalensis]
MAQVINTNSLSLLTQNNLNKSQSSLSSAIERLSSGLRINSAKDDAAGQAIANRFTANVKGLTQASRNANDGISIAQTTEGALSEINNNLQRVRELSVQATNGTNSQSDLDSIQNEITQRLSEIDRVSGQTQFNGVKVLASDSSMKIQVGANDGETITIDLKEITSDTLGLKGFNVNGKGELANTAATLKDMAGFTGTNVGVGITRYTNDAAKASSSDILAAVGTATGDKVNTSADVGLGAIAADYAYDKSTNTYKAGTVNGVDNAAVTAFLNPQAGDTTKATVTIGGKDQQVIIDKAGKLTAADDGAALYLDGTGNLTKTRAVTGDPEATLTDLADATGGAIATIKTSSGTFVSATGGKFNATNVIVSGDSFANAVKNGTYTATVDGQTYNVTTGTAGANAFMNDGKLSTTAPTYYAQADGSITTTQDASVGKIVYKTADGKLTTAEKSESQKTTDPLKALDKALAQVDALRSDLGAVQNRFDSTITNLGNTVNNLSSARSRIEDADYATEVSNMSRAQILQQAGTSVLAQANQTTQNVLSLLR